MGTCVEVEYSRDGSAEISVLVYALALMASRVKNGSVEVKQEASWSSAIPTQMLIPMCFLEAW
jgi:hypothetical protein